MTNNTDPKSNFSDATDAETIILRSEGIQLDILDIWGFKEKKEGRTHNPKRKEDERAYYVWREYQIPAGWTVRELKDDCYETFGIFDTEGNCRIAQIYNDDDNYPLHLSLQIHPRFEVYQDKNEEKKYAYFLKDRKGDQTYQLTEYEEEHIGTPNPFNASIHAFIDRNGLFCSNELLTTIMLTLASGISFCFEDTNSQNETALWDIDVQLTPENIQKISRAIREGNSDLALPETTQAETPLYRPK